MNYTGEGESGSARSGLLAFRHFCKTSDRGQTSPTALIGSTMKAITNPATCGGRIRVRRRETVVHGSGATPIHSKALREKEIDRRRRAMVSGHLRRIFDSALGGGTPDRRPIFET